MKSMEQKVKGMTKAQEMEAVLAAGVSYEVILGFPHYTDGILYDGHALVPVQAYID